MTAGEEVFGELELDAHFGRPHRRGHGLCDCCCFRLGVGRLVVFRRLVIVGCDVWDDAFHGVVVVVAFIVVVAVMQHGDTHTHTRSETGRPDARKDEYVAGRGRQGPQSKVHSPRSTVQGPRQGWKGLDMACATSINTIGCINNSRVHSCWYSLLLVVCCPHRSEHGCMGARKGGCIES
jgi:hypothetical protein